jgi:hypothetical protein
MSVFKLSPTIMDFSGLQPAIAQAFKNMSLCGFSLGSSERGLGTERKIVTDP